MQQKEKIKVKEITVVNLVTPSKLPECDYVINPYIGCTNACKYCYASFMKRFTNHKEPWGQFLDVKICTKPIDVKKLTGKSIFIASVTDAYNHYESIYQKTRAVLKQLMDADCRLTISTKNDLILRDTDYLKQFKDVTVAFSINTTDENFKNDMDCASSIQKRFAALKQLHEAGIKTAVFVSPIFPGITEWKNIVLQAKDFVDEFWFENLNLRGDYRKDIFAYIQQKNVDLLPLYRQIYTQGDVSYWHHMAAEIETFCKQQGVVFKNYFHHEEIRKP